MNWVSFLQPIITLALTTVLGIFGAIATAWIYKKWGITVNKDNLDKAIINVAQVEEYFASRRETPGGQVKNQMAVNLQSIETGQSTVEAKKDVDKAVAISPNVGATSLCKQDLTKVTP